jgi:cyclase
MFRPRIIPVLLLKNKGLVKTVKFKNPTYIGDPINAVRIFNDLEADELVFLDITATNEGRTISSDIVKEIGDEAFMPFAVGGGICSFNDAHLLINAGAEKVVLNSTAIRNPVIVREIAENFGSQSLIVSIDVKKTLFGEYQVVIHSGKKKTNISPVEHAINMTASGAGEILINSIDRDGTMQGYDIELIRSISEAVDIPVIACGGAGEIEDFVKVTKLGKASAVAAGSMFVYHGPRKAVLINYPEKSVLKKYFSR